MKRVLLLSALFMLAATSVLQAADQPAAMNATIAPGASITMENWQQYKDFMPDGLVALFEGKYFWKMPPDMRIEIEPTDLHPLPRNYLEATEKYSGQVKIVEQPDGSLRLQNYLAGVPFPDPQEPHRGWKVLEDLWFRYSPNLLVDRDEPGCAIDSAGNLSCQVFDSVNRQLAYNIDKGIPTAEPAPDAPFLTEWFMTLEPENQKYTTFLVVSYADQSRPDDTYIFLPALRRSQRVSSTARCGEASGMDFTDEDFHSGFDSNITELQANYLMHKKIIALVDPVPPEQAFPEGYFMPLAWPRPSWAKW